jgi:hypothetical protein
MLQIELLLKNVAQSILEDSPRLIIRLQSRRSARGQVFDNDSQTFQRSDDIQAWKTYDFPAVSETRAWRFGKSFNAADSVSILLRVDQ